MSEAALIIRFLSPVLRRRNGPFEEACFFLFCMLKSAFMSVSHAHTIMCACTSVSMSPEPLPQREAFGLSRMQWHHQSSLRNKVHHAEMRNPLNCTCVYTWVCVCVKCWQIGLWARLPHTCTSCREQRDAERFWDKNEVSIIKRCEFQRLFHRCTLWGWGGHSATLSSSSSVKIVIRIWFNLKENLVVKWSRVTNNESADIFVEV